MGRAPYVQGLASAPSGFYAWQQVPVSERAKADQRVLGLIKQSWLESAAVYGYRKVTCDLRDLGETCGKHRVARLMRSAGLRSTTGYGRRPSPRAGKPSDVSPNHLQRQFDVPEPNKVWVTDITYVRTHEGWLFQQLRLAGLPQGEQLAGQHEPTRQLP